MTTINEISNLLIIVLRAGLGFRVVFCCIQLVYAEDEQGMYKRRLKNTLIALVINELVWVIKDLILTYF